MVPLCIVYTFFAVIEVRYGKSEAIRQAEFYLRELTERLAIRSDERFRSSSQIADMMADFLSLDMVHSTDRYIALLRQNLASNPNVAGSCIAFRRGAVHGDDALYAPYVARGEGGNDVVVSDLGVEYLKANRPDYTQWPWFRKPEQEGKGSWSEPYLDEGGGGILTCTYAAPFFQDGRFQGVATVDLSLQEIRSQFSRISGTDVMFRLISANGTFISAPSFGGEIVMTETIFSIAEKRDIPELVEIGREMLAGKSGIRRCRDFQTGDYVWLAYAPMPEAGWSLMAAIPESKIMNPLYVQLRYAMAGFLLVFLIITVIIVYVSYRITTPIKRLSLFAGELAEGNLDAHVGDLRLQDEIGQLALALDTMASRLKSNIEQRVKEETARKNVENELRIARRIQASLLPRIFPPFPERKEFELHALNEPAAYIAGDFFDFFFIDPDTLALVIADVSGHGIPAAMFMAVARTAIRNFSVRGFSTVEIMQHVNRVLNTDNDDMVFVTAFYGHYSVSRGRLAYVNAGHNPPYLVRKNGALEKLEPTGPLLATFEEISYTEGTARLEPDDLLLLFTDGVTEAHTTANNELFGERRLEHLLNEVRNDPVETICNKIYATVENYSRRERHDDVTLLALKRNPPG